MILTRDDRLILAGTVPGLDAHAESRQSSSRKGHSGEYPSYLAVDPET
jgi:hypothetical protein